MFKFIDFFDNYQRLGRMNTDKVREILSKKIKDETIGINDFDRSKSLIHYAVEANNIKTLKLLIDKGADVNIQTGDTEDTPLRIACELEAKSDNFPMVELLLNNNANVNIVNKEGVSPFITVIGLGSEKLFRRILKAKPPPNELDPDNENYEFLLEIADLGANESIKNLLVDIITPKVKGYRKKTAKNLKKKKPKKKKSKKTKN
jgi:ankyrin repeat protein